MTAPVLRLDNVLVRAGGRTLLDVEAFTVAAGETVALIGLNGAGKTTLLHVAALLRHPDAGTTTIRSALTTPHNAATLRRALSVVFQAPLLFDVTVLANAAAGLRFQGYPRAEAETRARAWLKRFGVDHLANRKARSLSGGEAGRVALARAFATEPAILLLDEPFGALDAPSRAALLPALRQRLRETGAAAVLVTHDLDEAIAFADRLVVMDAGRIVAVGDAQDLIARPPPRETAKLLGVETILLAHVTSVDAEYACVTVHPAGPSTRIRIDAKGSCIAGQSVIVTLPAGAARALRPNEQCSCEWNCLPGAVREVTSLASGARLVVETPAPIVALAPWDPSARRWTVGDHAIVAFAPEAAHLIPETP